MADVSKSEIEAALKSMRKTAGEDYVFRASEAPPVKVISTGIPSLDVATGVGGWPTGTVNEIFGKPSVGKTALMLYTFAEAHKLGKYTLMVNLESAISKEGWLDWANSIAPPGWDPEMHFLVQPKSQSESIKVWGEQLEQGLFGVYGFDSLGALSTDKELQVGESKQAYGQAGIVTQLVKQSMHFASGRNDTGRLLTVVFLNQIRDGKTNMLTGHVPEKAPGGHSKEHGATLRINLTKSQLKGTERKINGALIPTGFTVGAKIVKNKVGPPGQKTTWDYWDYDSPDGVVGIDVFKNGVDTFLQQDVIERNGGWYNHEDFPGGKLNGGAAVTSFFRKNPESFEKMRKEASMKQFSANQSKDES